MLQPSSEKPGSEFEKFIKLFKLGLAVCAMTFSTSCSEEAVGAAGMLGAVVLMAPVAGLHTLGESRPSRVQPVRVQTSNGKILSPAFSKKPRAEFTANSRTVKCTGKIPHQPGTVGNSEGLLKCDKGLKARARINDPVGGMVRNSVLSITVGPASIPVVTDEFSNVRLGKTDYQCGGFFQWTGANIDPFLVLCGHPRSHAGAVWLIPAGKGNFTANVWIDPTRQEKEGQSGH